ncbi:MotE family protein [Pelagibacterium sp.]|uniref:MotE family protein n=1 Tax=Pelagibacterium sp. TaxID=1967288 RepID=UPI003A8E279D
MKQVRLLPVVVVAASALLLLKTFGIVSGQGYILGGMSVAQAAGGGQVAEQAVTDPAAEAEADGEEPQTELSAADAAAQALFETFPADDADLDALEDAPEAAPGSTEAIILQRLAERRTELESFATELQTRLAVVEAAEMRIEERMSELSAMETQINALVDAQENAEAEQFAAIVAMYENMRASDAATIFNDLDETVLVRVGQAMNPRKLGPIMAKMIPANAQQLTVLLAQTGPSGPVQPAAQEFANLPQIVGQ